MGVGAPPGADTLSWRRIETLIEVAGAHRTTVDLSDLVDLMPRDGPDSVPEVASWLERHQDRLQIVEGRAVGPRDSSVADLAEREARGAAFWAAAVGLFEGPLAGTRRWVQAVGVTGSTAYGRPERGDDLDFLVVTRSGAVWVFLAMTYLRLRIERARGWLGPEIAPCFNYVLDDTQARRDFARPRGLLVAREAMTTRVLLGEEFYRGLVVGSPWLAHEAPRLFDRWRAAGTRSAPDRPAPRAIRLLNALLFPALALYLHLTGSILNRRFARRGVPERRFVTETGLHRLAVRSERFDRLSDRYATASTTEGAP